MDCNCNQWNPGPCRPQMSPPATPYRPAEPARPIPQTTHPSLAMAYVPWQQWRQTYPMEQGFVRGTIFPELDLPFVMGRCR